MDSKKIEIFMFPIDYQEVAGMEEGSRNTTETVEKDGPLPSLNRRLHLKSRNANSAPAVYLIRLPPFQKAIARF